MATGAWLTNRGKKNLLLGRGATFKAGLLVGTQPAGALTQVLVADLNTVNDLLVTAGATECSAGGYARQAMATFTATEDDTNDRVNIDFADIAFGALAAGQSVIGSFVLDTTVDTNDTTRDLISVDWFASAIPLNGGTFTYTIADIYRLS